MYRVMTACFWICIACILVGATLGLLIVWDVVHGDDLRKVWLSILIVFLASAMTLALCRTYVGKDGKP